MNFMFSLQEQYLTSERSQRVRYCSCYSNIKFISFLIGLVQDDVFVADEIACKSPGLSTGSKLASQDWPFVDSPGITRFQH